MRETCCNRYDSIVVLRHNSRIVGAYSTRKEFSMYIDPNTGGILFQALAGLLAVISGVLLVFSRNIRQWIAGIRRRARKDDKDVE